MKTRVIAAAIAVMLAASSFAGCSGSNATSKEETGTTGTQSNTAANTPGTPEPQKLELKGELRVFTNLDNYGGGDPETGAIYEYFSKNHPGLKLIEKNLASAQATPKELTTAMAAGEIPDVYLTWAIDMPQLVELGFAEPLDDYLAKNADYVKSLIPSAFEINKINGKTYGVSTLSMPAAVYCNLDLFDKAGVPYPTDDWTIDEYIELAKKLTDKSQPRVGMDIRVNNKNMMYQFLEGYGVKGYKEVDGKKVSNLAEDKDAITALEKWLDLTARNNIPFTDEEYKKYNINWSTAWRGGYSAMYPAGSLWAQPYDTEKKTNSFKTAVFRVPKGPNGRGTMPSNQTLAIHPSSKNKDLAFEYIKVLTSAHFYNNAVMKPKTKNADGTEKPEFQYMFSPEISLLPLGIPSIATKFTTHKDIQRDLDGFVKAVEDMKMPVYGGAYMKVVDELIKRVVDVSNNKVQLVDALKEYDNYMNQNVFSKLK